MTTSRQPESVSVVLSRWKARSKLWLTPEYRRNSLRVLWTGLSMNWGIRLTVFILATTVVLAWLILNPPGTPARAYQILSWILAYASVIAAAPVFAEEMRQGTLELVWLSSGSARSCINYKAAILFTLFALYILPIAFFFSTFFDFGLPFMRLAFFLFINTCFTISLTMTLAAPFPHPWVAALLAAIPITGLLILAGDNTAFYNPFLNPFGGPQVMTAGGGAFAVSLGGAKFALVNRLLILVLSLILLSTATRLLRRVF